MLTRTVFTMNELINKAKEAAQNAYCPYSRYHVGAALLGESGKIYTGCNVENASFGATCCAERSAVFNAIAQKENRFKAIAIFSFSETGEASLPLPCGICRQVLAEFCNEDFIIIAANSEESREFTLGELLPQGFKL